jgi:hypothetical protein
MYHSKFYDMLYRLNGQPKWRRLLGSEEADLHMKDIEVLLRGFAMLIDGEQYTPSMVRFLNQFSRKCRAHDDAKNEYLKNLFVSFLNACEDLPQKAFLSKKNNRFNIALYEAVFTATTKEALADKRLIEGLISEAQIATLESDEGFVGASLRATTSTSNVAMRLQRAREIVTAL